MLISLKLKPFAECSQEDCDDITDFDDEEWDLVADMFERLVRNFKQAYPKVNIKKLETHQKPYIYMELEKKEFLEEELDYYIEILSGYDSDNIIFFDDIKYIVRCELTDDEKETIIDRFNRMIEDFAPELIQKDSSPPEPDA